jgi:2-amino-4-hydroxy-6-hydroxymethyldihydropteridine diphosphokinase
MAIVYLSLGSNKGDRIGYVQQAASLLGADDNITIVRTSAFYETEPWNMNTQTWFVNAIVEAKTKYSPKELLEVCQRIEKQLGRELKEGQDYQDRTIDIDIIFYDNIIINTPTLTIPHKHFHRRVFMLIPMLEIAPDFVHPFFGKTVENLYEAIDEPEMVYLYGTRI